MINLCPIQCQCKGQRCTACGYPGQFIQGLHLILGMFPASNKTATRAGPENRIQIQANQSNRGFAQPGNLCCSLQCFDIMVVISGTADPSTSKKKFCVVAGSFQKLIVILFRTTSWPNKTQAIIIHSHSITPPLFFGPVQVFGQYPCHCAQWTRTMFREQ